MEKIMGRMLHISFTKQRNICFQEIKTSFMNIYRALLHTKVLWRKHSEVSYQQLKEFSEIVLRYNV